MREALPARRESITRKFHHRGIRYFGTAAFYADGRLGENFIAAGKVGSTLEAVSHELAVASSLAYQHGCPAETMRTALPRLDDGAAAGPLGALLDMLAAEVRT